MKAVIQRVTKASVTVGNDVISSIGRGVCVLVGVSKDDTEEDMDFIIRKILKLRLFPSESRPWDKSVSELDLEVLSVSQFTLYGILKGNKLDFHNAMAPEAASIFYSNFLEKLKSNYKSDKVQDGKFAAYMSLDIVNDGPVTITLDSKKNVDK